MSIEALRNLDQGNRVVERCVDYLSHLLTVLSSRKLREDLSYTGFRLFARIDTPRCTQSSSDS